VSHRRARRASGFALIETIMAIAILAVGLLGVAALLARLNSSANDSRYTSTEIMLASSKLEDLNQVASANLAAGGSLNPGAPQAGYFDQVQVSSNGSNKNVVVDPLDGNPVVAPTSDMQVFERLWVIESNVPLGSAAGTPAGPNNGLLRITVIVIPQTGTAAEKTQTFQSSLVRPL
jgi:type II secretory pathway pseudopilin PulG